MLSEDALQNLVQPIVDRQENISNYIIRIIAQRVREFGELLPSDVHALERLLKSGADVKKINAELARLTGLQVKDIKKLIRTVALDSYLDAKPFYDYRHKAFVPFAKNEQLQRVVASIANQTADTYVNMSKAQAFMIRDMKNPKVLIPTDVSKTYYSVIDEAVQATQTGAVDYNTAMRRTMEQLADSGLRTVTYNTETGKTYTQRLDTAVRRNILDGVRAINQGVQDEVGKQFGADGKEITVHANSAPDHEPVQGHQFTNEEYAKLQNEEPFRDYNGKEFEPIRRAIGTLNCRHFTYSIILGVMKPNFTQEQLDEYIRKNHEGYTAENGKHMTMYDCTQYQRMLETKVRRAKDGQIMAKESGDDVLAQKYQAKIDKYMKQYQSFSKACGLSMKTKKIYVSGYTRAK